MNLRNDLGSFDLVHAANLLCRLTDPEKLLARLPQLVRSGGQLLLATPCTWLEEFTLDIGNGGATGSVGEELEERVLPPVHREQLRKYAEASGDVNPIHLSDEAAEAAGLPGVIAHGMLTVATMGLLFSPYLEHGHVKSFRSRFSGMVSP